VDEVTMRIGIVGGGISGCYLAYLLGRRRHHITIFDPHAPWEKPCGGGITYRTLQKFSVLNDFSTECLPSTGMEMIGIDGSSCSVQWDHPLFIASRESLGRYLLEKAASRGATLLRERVREIFPEGKHWRVKAGGHTHRFDFLVGADGVQSLVRRSLVRPFNKCDTTLTVGYWIEGGSDQGMVIGFAAGITGYIWVFPGKDHVSVGIGAGVGEKSGRELYTILDDFLRCHGPALFKSDKKPYAALIPSLTQQGLSANTLCGSNWALAGDASGLVDPLTGEGIFYAFQSAEFLASALIDGRTGDYEEACQKEIFPELSCAASYVRRFFDPRITARLVTLSRSNESVKRLLARLIVGEQKYGSLKKEALKIIPGVARDLLSGAFRVPSGGVGEST
jgi:flavin-dependent dehydrogenase